jgi:bifunctional UDP-N-acetylglucosamine pyrophosphorylase/glucosamine-1-phosphate N-acetyltransferase
MSPEARTAPRRIVPVVLAAGLGTRMRSRLPKVLHPVCGRPMLAYVLDAAREATGERPLVVISPSTTAVRDAFETAADFALQAEPRGTGDAVRAALDCLPAEVAEVLVLSGDVPRLRADLLGLLLEQRRLDQAAFALTAVASIDPAGLGRVVRNEIGAVERIVEEKDATDDEREIPEINAGLYAFDADWLRSRIGSLTPSPVTGELYLTQLVGLARADGRLVTSLDVEDDGRLLGINDRSQLAQAEWDLRTEINEAWMLRGVTMLDPSTVYLDSTVDLGEDVTLEPNVILRGRTRIGSGTMIAAGSTVIDSVVGRDCRVWASVVEGSELEDQVTVGPFAHLRPGTVVGRGAEVGNYAELKATRLGAGVKQHHVSYLGDAELGDGTNVGAGTITANYDGRAKHRTRVGRNAFLGVDTMLIAPVEVGDGGRTGAGAVVTHDVPPGSLVVGVPARPRPTPRSAATPEPVGQGEDESRAGDEPPPAEAR